MDVLNFVSTPGVRAILSQGNVFWSFEMTPITPFLLLAPLYNAASAQKFRFPTPNEPETPNVPNPIHPVGVPHIAPPGSPGSYPQAPSQQQLQHNLGTLEEKLGHIHDVVDVVTEVVNAILATPSAATWNGVAYPVASSTRNATSMYSPLLF
jgi:hypothetical protein